LLELLEEEEEEEGDAGGDGIARDGKRREV
jgi:hypothetical protein